MRYLLDTHVILWALIDDKRIPKDIKEKLLNSNNQVYYSTVSPWEVEIKHQEQKISHYQPNNFVSYVIKTIY